MYCEEFPWGVVCEYPLLEASLGVTPSWHPRIHPYTRSLSLHDYSRLYHREQLVTVGGQKYPSMLISLIRGLDELIVEPLTSPYRVPRHFEEFSRVMTALKVTPDNFNGSCIGVRGVRRESTSTIMSVQETKYFDFLGTANAQDVLLHKFDTRLPQDTTLRDYEVVDGAACALKDSNLGNILAVGFIVRQERDNYFILGKRASILHAYGNSLGILGGTPAWNSAWNLHARSALGPHLKRHFEEEMKEELSLEPNEFCYQEGFLLRDLVRAPILVSSLTTSLSIEEIARRCTESVSAKKEHVSIVAIPATVEAVSALARGVPKYILNSVSAASLYLSVAHHQTSLEYTL